MSGCRRSPLVGTGVVYCTACGVVGRGGSQCRGKRSEPVGSTYLAIKSLQHDWRNNPQGYSKHYGGSVQVKRWDE
jgi:hypothetical protein